MASLRRYSFNLHALSTMASLEYTADLISWAGSGMCLNFPRLSSVIPDWYRHPALVLYEICITIEDEVALVWQRRVTATTILFIMNRWALIIPVVYNLLLYPFIPSTPTVSATFPDLYLSCKAQV